VRGRLSVLRGAGLLDGTGELTAWQERPDSDSYFALARSNGSLIAACSSTGAYSIDPAAGTISVSGAGGEDWEHRLGTTAVPLLLAERGDLVLHASAVLIEDRAVLFCGPSGRGKSTLALIASSAGHPVLSEDGAVIELGGDSAVAWPGPGGVCSDGGRAGGPRTISTSLEAPGPAPVGAVCFLAPRGPRLEVTPLAPAQAVSSLVPSLVHAGDEPALRAAFERLLRLLELVPAFRVTMPDDLGGAPQATRSALASLSASSAAFTAPSQPSSRSASSELRSR
jgi:hypothetical protein